MPTFALLIQNNPEKTMKKIFAIVIAAISILVAGTSCTKDLSQKTGIFFTPETITLAVGQTGNVSFSAVSESGGYGQFDITYSDRSVAAVVDNPSDGVLTVEAYKAGTCTISLRCSAQNISGSFTVIVQ